MSSFTWQILFLIYFRSCVVCTHDCQWFLANFPSWGDDEAKINKNQNQTEKKLIKCRLNLVKLIEVNDIKNNCLQMLLLLLLTSAGLNMKICNPICNKIIWHFSLNNRKYQIVEFFDGTKHIKYLFAIKTAAWIQHVIWRSNNGKFLGWVPYY